VCHLVSLPFFFPLTVALRSGNAHPITEMAAWLLVSLILLGCSGILQLALVPTAAAERGRDGAIWFMVTVIWLFFNAGAIYVLLVVAEGVAIVGISAGTAQGFLVAILASVFALGIIYLPLIVIYICPPVKTPGTEKAKALGKVLRKLRLLRRERDQAVAQVASERGVEEPTECPKCRSKWALRSPKCVNCGLIWNAPKKPATVRRMVVQAKNTSWIAPSVIAMVFATVFFVALALRKGTEGNLDKSPHATRETNREGPSQAKASPPANARDDVAEPRNVDERPRSTRLKPAVRNTPEDEAIARKAALQPAIRQPDCPICQGLGLVDGSIALQLQLRKEVYKRLADQLGPLLQSGQPELKEKLEGGLEEQVRTQTEIEYWQELLRMKARGERLPAHAKCSYCSGSGSVDELKAIRAPRIKSLVSPPGQDSPQSAQKGTSAVETGPKEPVPEGKVAQGGSQPSPGEAKPEPSQVVHWVFHLSGGGKIRAVSYSEKDERYSIKLMSGSTSVPKESVLKIEKLGDGK
jgi:hypothetical protein